jgi:hypothetical protein
MKRARGWIPALLLALAVTGAAIPAARASDRSWVHPEIERLRPARIAILPAVSFVYLPTQRAYFEDAWLQRFARTRHAWVPAILCRERMASTSRRGDSLLSRVGDQIRSRGRVDSAASASLARLLESQALLCLRIDRWERLGRGGNERIFVDMTATLVDSTGRLLWRVTSEERLESAYGIPKSGPTEAPAAAGDDYEMRRGRAERTERWIASGRPGEMGVTGQVTTISPDFQAAVGRILARWERLFPAAATRASAGAAR